MQIWGTISPDNELVLYLGTWRNRILRQFPRVDSHGFVHLEGWPYVVDPHRSIRRKIRRFGRERENIYQFWRLNEPDPILFDATMTPGSIGVTGETIALYSKSEHLRRLVQPEKDWLIYAIIAIIMAVAGAGIGYSLGIQAGLNGAAP